MDKEMFLALYKSIARPSLEYGSSISPTIYKKDKIAIEKMFNAGRQMFYLPGIQPLSYGERLRVLGIPLLQYREIFADLAKTINEIAHKCYTLSLCRGHSCLVRLAKQETLTPPGHLVSPLICTGP